MVWFVYLSILVGMAFLAMSLPSITSILRTLGHGRLRTNWMWLRGLILAFILGYAAFGLLRVEAKITTVDLIVTMIFAAGGAFVFIVARLSELTTSDIVRVSALERDVIRDPLTGLFNRRYLDARLDEEADRARGAGIPFSALLVDLDHFKHINDTYGHPIGDQVLRHVSGLLAAHARSDDTVVRYGGEEFVILASNCGLEEAISHGERLRSAIAADAVALPDGREVLFTASLGAATFVTEETPAELLKRADEALYDAKRSGRNRVCSATFCRQLAAA